MAHIVRKFACAVALVAGATVTAPTAALAAPPVIERVQVQDTFLDEFLTDACGVTVTTTASGMFTVVGFNGGQGTGPVELRAINIALTITAGDNTLRLRDVGVDLVRVEPDGTVVLSIVGQIPLDFTGVLKVDLVTGEVILEPHHFADIADACAVLTA
jgi:hypothetical protein